MCGSVLKIMRLRLVMGRAHLECIYKTCDTTKYKYIVHMIQIFEKFST